MRLSYVLPVHNEQTIIRGSVELLVSRLAELPGSEVILVENGSSDESLRIATELTDEFSSGPIKVVTVTSPKGFGNAWRKGIDVALGDVILLSAADVPFGFSDLDGYLLLDDPPPLVIGSKAHPDSLVATGPTRRLLSWAFNRVWRIILGLQIGDTQGAFFLQRDLAKSLLPELRSARYFISTEIAALVVHREIKPLEIPVRYLDPRPDSKVRPIGDGYEMLKNLFELRVRLKSRGESG